MNNKMKENNVKIPLYDYDKKHDIMYCNYGPKNTKHSKELDKVNIILDFDEEDNIVGFEIFDFMKKIKESRKKMDNLMKGGN